MGPRRLRPHGPGVHRTLSLQIAVVTRDRYRTWELKSLHRAALRRKVELTLLDPLAWSVSKEGLLDERGRLLEAGVVLGRVDIDCLYEGLRLLASAESFGIPTVNGSRTFHIGRDKIMTTLALQAAGLPHPRTWLLTRGAAARLQLPYPLVMKPLLGSRGKGIRRLDNPAALKEALAAARSPLYLQEFATDVRRDLRLLVIGGRVVASICRRPPRGEWRANLALGARPEPFKPPEELASLALRAAAAIGADFAGVDLLETASGPLVLEVNVCPSFVGVSSATGVDVAGHLVEYLKAQQRTGVGA